MPDVDAGRINPGDIRQFTQARPITWLEARCSKGKALNGSTPPLDGPRPFGLPVNVGPNPDGFSTISAEGVDTLTGVYGQGGQLLVFDENVFTYVPYPRPRDLTDEFKFTYLHFRDCNEFGTFTDRVIVGFSYQFDEGFASGPGTETMYIINFRVICGQRNRCP